MAAQTSDKKLDGAGLATLWGLIKAIIPTVPTNISSFNNDAVYVSLLDSHNANLVLASPNGASGLPSFRALVAADIPDLSGTYLTSSSLNGYATQSWVTSQGFGTVSSIKVGDTSYSPSSGVVSLPAYPTSLPASDVYSWAKASSKPSYTLSEISDRFDTLINFSSSAPSCVGYVSPLGMAISPEHGANRLAFLNPAAMTFEYSSDGSNWNAMSVSDARKTNLVTLEEAIPVGRETGEYYVGSKTRITFTCLTQDTTYLYCSPKKMLINISASAAMSVMIEFRSGTNMLNNGSWWTFGTFSLSGWSGWNEIPLVVGTLGGGVGQWGNNAQMRLTFTMDGKWSDYPETAFVNAIRLFADNIWFSSNSLASKGNIYSIDSNMHTYFPNDVYVNNSRVLTENDRSSMSVNYANTAGSAPPYFANSTWYAVGDDSAIGDHDVGGTFCIKGLNATPAIKLFNSDNTEYATVIHTANIGSQSVSYASSAGNADTVGNIGASGFFRNFGTNGFTSCDSINAQGITTIDGYSQGPDSSANVTVLNLGEYSATRFKQLLFNYENDNIYYRRNNGENWTSWVSLITSSNIGSQSVNYASSAGNADTVDGYHEYSFLRYRGSTETDGEGSLWNQIGIKDYEYALPDGLSDVYPYGGCVSLAGGNSRLDIYYPHIGTDSAGIWVRTGWSSDKQPWKRLAFTSELSNYLPLTGGTLTGTLTGTEFVSTRSGQGCQAKLEVTNDNFPTLYVYSSTLSDWYSLLQYRSSNNSVTIGNSNLGTANVYGSNVILYCKKDGAALEVARTVAKGYFIISNGATSAMVNAGHMLYVNGSVGATSYNNISDVRDKEYVSNLSIDINSIANAPLFRFKWKHIVDEKIHAGSSAQYWQTVLPENVFVGGDDKHTLSMQYDVIALLSSIAIAKEVVNDKERIRQLEQRVSQLEAQLAN